MGDGSGARWYEHRAVFIALLIGPPVVIPVLLALSLSLPTLPLPRERLQGLYAGLGNPGTQVLAWVTGGPHRITVIFTHQALCQIPGRPVLRPGIGLAVPLITIRCPSGMDYSTSVSLERSSLPLYDRLASTVRAVAHAYYHGLGTTPIQMDLDALGRRAERVRMLMAGASNRNGITLYAPQAAAQLRTLTRSAVWPLPATASPSPTPAY